LSTGSIKASEHTATIIIKYADNEKECPNRPEAFGFRFYQNSKNINWVLNIIGYDDLGLIYGLLH